MRSSGPAAETVANGAGDQFGEDVDIEATHDELSAPSEEDDSKSTASPTTGAAGAESTQESGSRDADQPDNVTPADDQRGSEEPTGSGLAYRAEADLASLLPSPDAIDATTNSGYSSIDELIAQRAEQPPLLRCGAGDDPTSLAISSAGQAAGRTFDYDDGLRTTTVQLWQYPDPATASRAIALISALRCDATAVGPITIDGTVYEQSDSSKGAPATLSGEDIDEAVGASFERRLDAPETTLVVQEELQFARVGSLVLFAGAREIRSPDAQPSPPVDDAFRLGNLTTSAVLVMAGQGDSAASAIESPASVSISTSQDGTYRSVASSFCLVEIERTNGDLAQITWGAGEQAIVTISTNDANIDFGEGCGRWIPLDLTTAASTLSADGAGTLLVGIDIAAGPLFVASIGACTIDQLTGFSGAPTELLSSTILAPGESVELELGPVAGVYLATDCKY